MSSLKKMTVRLKQPFQREDRLEIKILLVFLVINLIVLVNALLHDPLIGYDALQHLDYLETLSHFRLVTPEDSAEFFSPPVPYALPALLMSLTGMKIFWAAKAAQMLNFVLSLGVTYFVIKIGQLLQPGTSLKFSALVFVGILPVYYKTFSQVRGEPYVVFFAILILYYTLVIILKKQYTLRNALLLGLAMGLSALSRQWGIFLFPGVFLVFAAEWIRFPRLRIKAARTMLILLTLILVVSGWFYATLQVRYGSIRAFNRSGRETFSLKNQSREFYLGLNLREFVSQPVRPNLPNLFFPLFYSEIWGDYWGYFTLYGVDTRGPEYINGYYIQQNLEEENPPAWFETNYEQIQGYLGRVNLVSLFPSALALLSLAAAAFDLLPRGERFWKISLRQEVNVFLLLSIGFTMVGYMWFLIMYPNRGKGDTIKAAYALQIFPYLAFLVGDLLQKVERKSHLVYWLIMAGLGLVFLHNLPASFTHYHFLRFL